MKTETRKLIPGVEIELAGDMYVLPPLTLGQLQDGGVLAMMRQNDELVAAGKFWEALNMKNKVIAEALRRNYPELSDEDVSGMLDMKNYDKAWEIVLGGSGLRSQAAREAADREVMDALRPTPAKLNGTLDPSTDPSSELTAGPGATSIN